VRLADGTGLDVSSVLWCTGFRPDTGWIDVPGAVDAGGAPVHTAGASPVPGLHWMGLPWQTRLNSSIIDGVDRDARAVAARVRAGATR
jgi:putative flavoprotein involved in K+ transport